MDRPPPPPLALALTLRFIFHTNLHRPSLPLLFELLCLRAWAIQWLLEGGSVQRGVSLTKGRPPAPSLPADIIVTDLFWGWAGGGWGSEGPERTKRRLQTPPPPSLFG